MNRHHAVKPCARLTTMVALLAIICLAHPWRARATMPSWRDVGREISLHLYLAARHDALRLEPQTAIERDRKALVLAFLGKKLGEKNWFFRLKGIPSSSPYRQAADLLLEEQMIVPESIRGSSRRPSPFMRKFYSLWRKDRVRALRLLLWAPGIPEKRKAVQIAFNRLFYEGEDNMVVATYNAFKSLRRSVSNIEKVALAHWRQGELKESISYLDMALKRAPWRKDLLFWKARALQRMGNLSGSVRLLRQVGKGMEGGFYQWYSRMLLGLVGYRGERCKEKVGYPDPVLYAMAESGLLKLGRKVLKDKVIEKRHPNLVSSSTIYPYQSMRLSYLHSENGGPCTRYPRPWRELVKGFADLYGIGPEMLYALIKAESSFNRVERSYSNALGLTQVLPSTGRWIERQRGKGYRLFPNQSFLPFFSLQLGGWYLHYLEREFHRRWPLVVASYNGGPGRTRRWLRTYPNPYMEEVAVFYPRSETRRYVKRLFIYQLRYLGASPRSE